MDDDGPGGSWVDHDDLIWAAGLAALLLVALLVWAVLRMSTDVAERDGPSSPGITTTTSAGTSSTVRTGSSTTSYPVPRPQTSEPALAPPPPPTDPTESAAPQPESPTPTTIYNPYAPTTTVPSAGSV